MSKLMFMYTVKRLGAQRRPQKVREGDREATLLLWSPMFYARIPSKTATPGTLLMFHRLFLTSKRKWQASVKEKNKKRASTPQVYFFFFFLIPSPH